MYLAYSFALCITSATSHINKGKLSNKSYEASGGFHREPHEISWGPLVASWGIHGNLIGVSWGPHEGSWGRHDSSWGPYGGFMGTS